MPGCVIDMGHNALSSMIDCRPYRPVVALRGIVHGVVQVGPHDGIVGVRTSAGADRPPDQRDLRLASAATFRAGQQIAVKVESLRADAPRVVRVIPAAGDHIEGSADAVLLRGERACLMVYTDGERGWFVLRGSKLQRAD
jgi:hypothetical protein